MKIMHSLGAYALMTPVITLCAGIAFAQAPYTTPDRAQDQQTTQGQQRTMPEQTQNEKGEATPDRAQEQRMAANSAQMNGKVHGTYLSSRPANSFRADELIGSDLKSRPDGETIGPISDLLIDENGQIVAVIVEVGGFLALGEKEVAISWDSVEHGSNGKGFVDDLTVSVSRDALTNAPELKTRPSSSIDQY